MASKIPGIIPHRNFERILIRIGEVLLTELTEQKNRQSIQADFSIFTERQEPYAVAEDVVIMLSCSNAQRDGKTQSQVMSNTTFFIDFFTNGTASMGESGNDNSRKKMHLFVGLADHILSSTIYKTLDFAPGLIGGTMVESLQFDDNYGNEDGKYIRFGRITYSVRHSENHTMWDGVPLLGDDTQIKIDDTDLGFKIIFNTNT